MTRNNLKTLVFAAGATLLAVAAVLATPAAKQPEIFKDQGQPFYEKDFNPLDVTGIEVRAYNDKLSRINHFSVEYKDGCWVIPSHQGYPADASEQLKKTAGVLNGLKKGPIVSDRKSNFADFGVEDPISGSASGQGTRVILKGKTGEVLVDYIIGTDVKKVDGQRHVRRADSERTYACQVNSSGISTRFADWVETDLLEIKSDDIARLELNNYKIDEKRGTIVNGERILLKAAQGELAKDQSKWTISGGLKAGQEINTDNLDKVISTLSELTLVNVIKKPQGLTTLLRRMSKGESAQQELAVLMNVLSPMGFFIAKTDSGWQMVSNEGEMTIGDKSGVSYRLRFGEVVYGEADKDSSEAGKKKPAKTAKEAEHRNAFITAFFDQKLLGSAPKAPIEPPKPIGLPEKVVDGEKTDKNKKSSAELYKEALAAYKKGKAEFEQLSAGYNKRVIDGQKKAEKLRKKFGGWFYVISSKAYDKLRVSRKDLIKEKEKKEAAKPSGP
jgi:Domain of unknown function (DUF4340)